jgi:hypothetical protein
VFEALKQNQLALSCLLVRQVLVKQK